jgi:ATP-dependent helicase/nuclease subunit B
MAVQFILGRSGTGKTSYCINAIAAELLSDNGESLIFLVPEQATYQAERAILADKGIDGYNRLNVLSFDRLEYLLLGKNTARESISRIGRQMIIHRILRQNADKLKIFGSSAHLTGMSQKMAQTIEEIQQYAQSPDDIDGLLGELQKKQSNSSTALKFSDIKLVLDEYIKYIENDFYDPDLQLKSICRAISSSDLTKGAKLLVDGFAGFTGTELAILAELIRAAADSKIALCLDPSRIDYVNPSVNNLNQADLFSPTEQTFAKLIEITQKNKLPVLKPVILCKPLRFKCPELAHIEKSIFETKHPKLKSAENIHVISAPNEREEVQYAGKQIVRLIREKGFRYRDIAVIASDIESYHHYIRAYFNDYNIPFFIDKRKSLSRHPVIELFCSALKIITEGFVHNDIFAYLKTDLVPLSRYEIDMLENYCIAFGISDNDWLNTKKWQFAGSNIKDFDENVINQIRTKSVSALLELKQSLNEEIVTAEQFTSAIFNLLGNLKVQDTITNWIESAKEQSDYEMVDEHQQFYNKMVDIFDELVEIFSGQAMSAADFYSIVNSAFSQMTLAFIPPTLDQVLVGSVERSRHPDLKAVILIGATQKQFPIPVRTDSILSDDDRKAAESLAFQLAAPVDRTLCERQYLTYIAFTRPSELLYITYPSIDEKGSGVPRSQFIGDIESLFENLHEAQVESEKNDIENISSEYELTDLLCENMGKDRITVESKTDLIYADILQGISKDEQLSNIGYTVQSAIDYDNTAIIKEETVGDLFEKKLKGSATRLGTFASCPYQHFARYILDLKKRKEFSLEPLDLGNFYHSVLDALVKRINKEKMDFSTIDNDTLVNVLNEEIEKYIKSQSFLMNFISRRLYNEFIINSACNTLRDFVLAMAQMIRAGVFKPCLSEVSFGSVKDSSFSLGSYEIKLPDNRVISLSGKIDRLDIADINKERKIIIFDYKRTEKSFNWSKYYHGLDLQLPFYMLAIREASDSKYKDIVGAFFVPIENKKEGFNYKAKGIFNGSFFKYLDKTIESGWSKYYNFSFTSKDEQYGYYSNSGVLKSDDFENVFKFAYKKIVSLAGEMLSGKIVISPYRLSDESPCKNCDYLSVCRFDWQINEYNSLESFNKTQVLEKIGGDNA